MAFTSHQVDGPLMEHVIIYSKKGEKWDKKKVEVDASRALGPGRRGLNLTCKSQWKAGVQVRH